MKTKLAQNFPLHELLQGVLRDARTKLAEDATVKDEKVKQLLKQEKKEHGHVPSVAEEKEELKELATKTASLTDPLFVEKLASAVDHIAANIDSITPTQKGIVAQAIEKLGGGESMPPAVPGNGSALATTKSIGGTQKYKKDQASGNTPEKEKGKPLSPARPHDGKSQLENNMHAAPGNNGTQVPHTTYPEHGVLANVKHAGDARQNFINALEKDGEGMCKHGKLIEKCGECGPAMKTKTDKTKTAGELARDLILQKLAGEDVLKAKISAPASGGALVGDGVNKAYSASERPPAQAGDPTSGFGNQARKHIGTNQAAIDYTKKDAKGPVKTQLKEVLDEPALSKKTDSKLQENLRSTGAAGVKIAANRAFLEKIAKDGTPEQKQRLKQFIKQANMGMGGAMGGGGMTAMAETGGSPEGCTCGGTGECRVCKLKAALHAAKGEGAGASGHAAV